MFGGPSRFTRGAGRFILSVRFSRASGLGDCMNSNPNPNPPADLCARLTAYEVGQLDACEELMLFADLVRTGLAWSLQGNYGRAAARLIDAGLIPAPAGWRARR